jgi:four helix bundle protein
MDVYRIAREFLQWVHRSLLPRLPRGHGEERDHLRRASLSILLNVAEGAQQESLGVKRKHFRIAKGSAGECAAVLDALAVVGVESLESGDALVRRLGAMLSRLSR